MKIDFKTLLLQLLPTFLRVGLLKACCNAVVTVLQRHFNSVYPYLQNKKDMIVWTSERKAMRDRLNLMFRGVIYTGSDEDILVEDGFDVKYPIAWNNDEFEGGVAPEDKRLIAKDTTVFNEALIVWNISDLGIGHDLAVIIPADGSGNINIIGNLQELKNETNRLVFAGLLCKFYKRKKSGNNFIDIEI